MRRITFVLMAIVLASMSYQRQAAAGLAAGEDYFSSIGSVYITVFGPSGFSELIDLSSQGTLTHVHRDAQSGTTINTEMVSLDLFGTSTHVGAVEVRAGSAFGIQPSLGQITDVVTGPGADPNPAFQFGNSFFDVFAEITIPSLGLTLANQDAIHMVANGITHLPPYFTPYQNFDTTLWFDKVTGALILETSIQPNGASAESHTPVVPEPSTLVISSILLGMFGAGGLRNRWKRTAAAV